MPKIVWKIRAKDRSGHNKLLRFKSFKEAGRYYNGSNPPIKFIDGKAEDIDSSNERVAKRIKEIRSSDLSKLKKIDVESGDITVKISSKTQLSMKNIEDAINEKYPESESELFKIRELKRNSIDMEVDKIRIAVQKIENSSVRISNIIY